MSVNNRMLARRDEIHRILARSEQSTDHTPYDIAMLHDDLMMIDPGMTGPGSLSDIQGAIRFLLRQVPQQ